MGAARGLVDRRRTKRQTTEFNKLYSGALIHALPACQKGGSNGDKGAGKGACCLGLDYSAQTGREPVA
eukprot:8542921-Heterocapsa_arctica.AAC.1